MPVTVTDHEAMFCEGDGARLVRRPSAWPARGLAVVGRRVRVSLRTEW